MKYALVCILLIAGFCAPAHAQCVGPRCPIIMTPIGDDSDLDKMIVTCNEHALGGVGIGKYESGFEYCNDVRQKWVGSPGFEKWKQEQKQKGVERRDKMMQKFSASGKMDGGVAPPVSPPPPVNTPMIIEPADADAFREIVEGTIPQKYNGLLIRWYNTILQRKIVQDEIAKKQH